MNIEELRQRKEDLEKFLKDHDELKDEEKEMLENQIADVDKQIKDLEHEIDTRTKGQFIGGVAGRIISGTASFLVGEVDACITGKTDEKDVKRDRARITAAGEKIGANIGGMAEKGIKNLREFLKGRK